MKRTIILLAALMLFAACNKDEEPAIDYSTWTTEELLADPNGIDYLVKTAGEVDYDALNEQLKTLVLVSPDASGWLTRIEGKWQKMLIDGGGISYYVVMDDGTYLKCYRVRSVSETHYVYEVWEQTENPIEAMINKRFPKSKIVAVVDSYVFVDLSDQSEPIRVIYRLQDCRESVLKTYTTCRK